MKKLSDVIGATNNIEFLNAAFMYYEHYKVIVKPTEWVYHEKLKQAGFYYQDMFLHVACKKCSGDKPHKCTVFHSNMRGVCNIVNQYKMIYG